MGWWGWGWRGVGWRGGGGGKGWNVSQMSDNAPKEVTNGQFCIPTQAFYFNGLRGWVGYRLHHKQKVLPCTPRGTD